jgi:hypothetical protein
MSRALLTPARAPARDRARLLEPALHPSRHPVSANPAKPLSIIPRPNNDAHRPDDRGPKPSRDGREKLEVYDRKGRYCCDVSGQHSRHVTVPPGHFVRRGITEIANVRQPEQKTDHSKDDRHRPEAGSQH